MPAVTNADVDRIPGWFSQPDVDLFRLLLQSSETRLGVGDLAELGVYLGRSTVLLGSYLRQGEQLTVADLFESPTDDHANQHEIDQQYAGLSRAKFEENYRALHESLPVIVHGDSSDVRHHARSRRHRFVHIDASHLYAKVKSDIDVARELLMRDGIVVLDDYRSEHTPGVAAAAWQAVGAGLRPFALTTSKMYATCGDPTMWLATVEDWLSTNKYMRERQAIGDGRVVRIWYERRGMSKYVPPILLPHLAKARHDISSGIAVRRQKRLR
jgi:predicted O-methyltransferase YrrM